MSRLWVFVAVVVCWLGTSCRAKLLECSQAADLVVGHTNTDLKPVLISYYKSTYYMEQTYHLYVEEGFQGVTLEVEGRHKTTSMFFPTRQECWNSSTTWWGVRIGCQHYKLRTDIWCFMDAGDCFWACSKSQTSPQEHPRYRVLAAGPSRWRGSPPPSNCEQIPWSLPHNPTNHYRTCRDPPLTTTISTPWIVAIVLLVLVLVLMGVVVVVVLRARRHTRATASLAAATPDTQAQSHNTPAASLTPRHHNLPAAHHDMEMMSRRPYAPAPTPPRLGGSADFRPPVTDDGIYDVIGEMETYLIPLPSPRLGGSARCSRTVTDDEQADARAAADPDEENIYDVIGETDDIRYNDTL